jgi:hypothetical protein
MSEERFAWGEETKHRARQSIMFYVLAFCTEKPYARRDCSWINGEHAVGDLVLLRCVRGWTKWNIGWLRGIVPHRSGWHKYVIESLEDGELCNWENVSFEYMRREIVADNPEWQWNDDQFSFWDRFRITCREECWSPAPMQPKFNGLSVELSMRERYEEKVSEPELFKDYREITTEMIVEFINRTKEKLNGRNRD